MQNKTEPARISLASWPEQLRALGEDVGPVADILTASVVSSLP